MTTILILALLVFCSTAGTIIGLKIAEPLNRLLKKLAERENATPVNPAPFHPNCRSVTFSGRTFHVPEYKFKLRPQKEIEKILAIKPWSKKHRRCQKCRTTSRPHHGHGLCRSCYTKKYPRPSHK